MSSILEVQKLAVQFGGIRALEDVSFSIAKGSITAIIGPNGAGKTTVFNCLTGFYRSTKGSIFYHSQDNSYAIDQLLGLPFAVKDLANPLRLASKFFYKIFGGSHLVAKLGIARTFQNIRLFKQLSVIENLLIAQHCHLKRDIWSVTMRTKGFKKSEQKALDTALKWLEVVGLRGQENRLAGELAYGLQRRLEIARAMCTGAQLICLDEPAAGLNQIETQDLATLICRLRDEFKVTVAVIEHDMSLVMNISDHIVVLDHGVVIAAGEPQTIKQDPNVLKAYLGEE